MRDFFLKDLGWKIFSLLLATALWFTANRILHESSVPPSDSSLVPITFGSLPVKVVSTEANVHEFHVAPATVKVTVIGPATTMNTLQADDIHATVNLIGASLSQSMVLPVEISLPPKIAITSLEPNRVLVTPPQK